MEKQQYDVPIGILACGKKEEMASFLRSEESESNASFDDPMLVFAGFTGTKLNQFLNAMYKQKIPRVNLKAMLTEYNVSKNIKIQKNAATKLAAAFICISSHL